MSDIQEALESAHEALSLVRDIAIEEEFRATEASVEAALGIVERMQADHA